MPSVNSTTYDLVIVGGGHAGAEAAWAAANLGLSAALVTMEPQRIGQMSCNPAIGGLAKGQMVREIDALGGLMGLAIDATGIQFHVLNSSKGPAVRGPRAQADKHLYALEVQRLLSTRKTLSILQGAVEAILTEEGRVTGLLIQQGAGFPGGRTHSVTLKTRAVVLTTGTFMRGLMHTGESRTPGGRIGESAAMGISDNLRALGMELGRLKTGTPPRLEAESIDFSGLQEQHGDDPPIPFSDMTPQAMAGRRFPAVEQRICWLTRTSEPIHQMIRDNLHRAPMYNGQIETAGPRYCPSIEDKVVRFAEKGSHQIFLEPEGLLTNEIYCNGISTSLPADVQEQIVRGLPGCHEARILRYGYAVEYDMVWPHQIDATCMTKSVQGLFLAGQINGTSGYEEAAGQGLIAGLNASRFVQGLEMIRLGRDQAYIGVMMDDLVTRTPTEPYRMFTSRAEHRLHLRSDNAAERLTPLGRQLGLVDDARWTMFEERTRRLERLREHMRGHSQDGRALYDWMRTPGVDEAAILERLTDESLPRELAIITALWSESLYAGFILRHQRQWQRVASQEARPLPREMDFASVLGLRREAGQVLNRFRPATLGQAARLAGITPADLTVLTFALGRG